MIFDQFSPVNSVFEKFEILQFSLKSPKSSHTNEELTFTHKDLIFH